MRINPLYTGRFFHCYMLDESTCHLEDVGSILSLLFYFWLKILLSKRTVHYFKPFVNG